MQQRACASVCASVSCFLVPSRQKKLPACAWSHRARWYVVSVVSSSCTGWDVQEERSVVMRQGWWVGRGLKGIGRYVQAGTAGIDTHLQCTSGRHCGQEMKSCSPLKESMKVLGEALGESRSGQSAEAAPGLLLHSRNL